MSVNLWSVYKITNILNNKIYIGQSKNPQARWGCHKANINKNNHLYLSMKKYGINNFTFEIIAQTKQIYNIDKLEVICIAQYNSMDRDFGYNKNSGGNANKIVSQETRLKLSKASKGRQTRLGSICSDETKKILSEKNKGNTYRVGVIVSDETKAKLSNINTGKRHCQKTLEKMKYSMLGKNKGENNGMYGKKSLQAKLSQEQADKIRQEYAKDNISCAKLGIIYGVSKKTILNILHNKIYIRK